MSNFEPTRELRRKARAAGIRCTEGLLLEGRRINRDDTTTLWCADGSNCVTFEQDADGDLYCADPLTPEQAVALFELVGGRRHGADA